MADDAPYQVALFQDVTEKVAAWSRVAEELGLAEWFDEAMDYIDRKLHSDPASWGDPVFTYRRARLRVYRGNHENFIVAYAIHMERPIVFFRDITLFAGSPLYGR